MSHTLIRLSERLYSSLLRLYPKRYQQQFATEMQYVFSQSLKDAYIDKGEPGILAFWTQTGVDVVSSVITQHFEKYKEGVSMKKTTVVAQPLNIKRVALLTGLLSLIPPIGMQLSRDWNWDETDFIFAGVLIFGLGMVIEYVLKRMQDTNGRILLIVGILVVFMLIWAELAVGLFGTPFAGN